MTHLAHILAALAGLALAASALEFDSVRITPRQDDLANAQVPKRWTLETSNEGLVWTPLLAGSFDNTTSEKILTVPKTRSRYLRFSSLESHVGKDQSAIAEIGVALKGKEYSKYDWKATANNELPATTALYGPASFAVDGDPQTCWHTTYAPGSTSPFPHVLTVDFGAEFKQPGNMIELSWDANPEAVTGYIINYGNQPDTMTQALPVGVATTTAVRNLPPGEWYFAIKAQVDALESESSTMVAATLLPPPVGPPAPVPAPKKMRVVRIETSSNLTDWEPLAFVPLHTASDTRFVRAGITEITP